jgi:DUF1707 SHOCT-like domain
VGGEIEPSNRDMRISDAEREQVVAQLNAAVAEGRLTLAEFEERVDGVLRSRTYGEVEPFLADLPTVAPSAPAGRDVVELRNHASSMKRTGRWSVPRRLVLVSKAGSFKLNFTDAVIPHQVIHVDLDVVASSTELILPAGASADLDDIDQVASSAKSRVPAPYDAQRPGVRFQITGKMRASSLKVRYIRRFWRWRW